MVRVPDVGCGMLDAGCWMDGYCAAGGGEI